jgi:hypothetical protein
MVKAIYLDALAKEKGETVIKFMEELMDYYGIERTEQ